MNNIIQAPVITVDGPSGTGKGTVSLRLANALGWHYLDSGSIYRVLAYSALQQKIAVEDENALIYLAHELDIEFDYDSQHKKVFILLAKQDVSQLIRSEECGNNASKISALAGVRQALIAKQRTFKKPPGLITDGRDMGTVIFPDANLKIFLAADPAIRAERRYNQLKAKGIHVSLEAVASDLQQRDQRDSERKVAPLKPAPDAIVLDTSYLDAEQVFNEVMTLIIAAKLFGSA